MMRGARDSTSGTAEDGLSKIPESHLARAVFAQVVIDLAEPERERKKHRSDSNEDTFTGGLAGAARWWLFADDHEDVAWRDELALLADVDLDALRDAVDDAPIPRLRKIARLLDKGGRW